MAVLSNKPVNPSRDIVQASVGAFFVRIYGGNSFTTKKPTRWEFRQILEETGFVAELREAIMIGEFRPLMSLTGRNAGL